jgi:signal transduction histidine kinase
LLTNVVRHAEATRVDVLLSVQGDRWVMEVVDDGRGITAAQAGDSRAIGLLGMRERAIAVGGRFAIGPGAAGGTRAVVSAPMTDPPDGKAAE